MLNDSSNCDNLINPVTELIDKLQSAVIDKDSTDGSLSSTATTVVFVDKKPEMIDCGIETDDFVESIMKENADLKEQCDNFQQVVELLRTEYDNCENYWASKLDEERQIYEQEQKQSSEKLAELLIKIAEYEEQFARDERLPPIEENDCLEKQYTELDEEFQEFKRRTEEELDSKDKEIEELHEKLSEVKCNSKLDVEIQVNILEERMNQSDFKISNLSNVIESSNIFSSETHPHLWKPPMSSISSQMQSDSADSSLAPSNVSQPMENLPTFTWNVNPPNEIHNACNSLPATISWQSPTAPSPQPHSLNILPDNEKTSNTYCVKRSRKHDRNAFQFRSKKEHDVSCNQFGNGHQRKWNNFNFNDGNQTCVISISSIHHLHRRLHELDQHCRHLQFVLKQQQQHSESLMQRKYCLSLTMLYCVVCRVIEDSIDFLKQF